MAEEKKETLEGKELIKEALEQAIRVYRLVEKFTFQEGNKKVAKMIGFTKLAIKEVEKL